MNIAIYVPLLAESSRSNFIVETFFPLFQRLPTQKLILITDNQPGPAMVSSEMEVLLIKPAPKNSLVKKLWVEGTCGRLLKKCKADIFISADNFCVLNTSLPQFILLPDLEKIKLAYANKAQLLIVLSESNKKMLLDKLKLPEYKITVVHPSSNKVYVQIDTDKRESIKTKYSEGKEYFLFNSNIRREEDTVELLKSFSHFKKRLQSNFMLIILGQSDFNFKKIIENYKYRDDVVFIRSNDTEEKAAITAAAYALVFPFSINEDVVAALNGMRSGVPIIATKNSSINEVAGDTALHATNDIKDIGEKMMQLYKDETLRSELIQKGIELTKNLTEERYASELWQSITKAMN